MASKLLGFEASVGEIMCAPLPGPMPTHWIVVAWDSKNKWWKQAGHFWTARSAAEKYAAEMPARYTHYRVVTIPGRA